MIFALRTLVVFAFLVLTMGEVLALDASHPPGQNFDLSRWRLTLPVGQKKDPDTVSPAQLEDGYASEFFFSGADGAMVFFVPSKGVTTKNSNFPRSEMREVTPENRPYNWSITDGAATLEATIAVTQVPHTGKLVVGQVHSAGAKDFQNEPLLMLSYEHHYFYDSLVALVRKTPTSKTTSRHMLKRFHWFGLGKQITYSIQVLPSSTLTVTVNGKNSYSGSIDSSWHDRELYFKAGNYLHDDSDAADEGGSVSFYALTVSHER